MSRLRKILLPWLVIRELESDIMSREMDSHMLRNDFLFLLSSFMRVIRENGYRVRRYGLEDGQVVFAELPTGTYGCFVKEGEADLFEWMPVSLGDDKHPSLRPITRYAYATPPVLRAIPVNEFLSLVSFRSNNEFKNKVMNFIVAVKKLSDGKKPVYLIETRGDRNVMSEIAEVLTDANIAAVMVPEKSLDVFAATEVGGE